MRGTTLVSSRRKRREGFSRWLAGRGMRARGLVRLTPIAPPSVAPVVVLGAAETAFVVDRVANWSAWKTSPDTYIQSNYDSVRILCHIDNTQQGIDQPSERFTESNQGWTVRMEMDRAAALGLNVHLVLDFYYGSGRNDNEGTGTGPGRYHYSWAEGGMQRAIDDCFRWMPTHVISFTVGNEPSDVQWLAEQYDKYWMSHARSKCKQRGIPLIGWDGDHLGPMSAKWCNEINVHSVNSQDGRAAQKIKDARRLGLPVGMMEFASRHMSQYRAELSGALAERPFRMGGFPNSPEFKQRDTVYWNFNTRSQFGHTYEGGVTPPGTDWSSELGSGDAPPPSPPPPDPQPPPPDKQEIPVSVARQCIKDAENIQKRSKARQGQEWRVNADHDPADDVYKGDSGKVEDEWAQAIIDRLQEYA